MNEDEYKNQVFSIEPIDIKQRAVSDTTVIIERRLARYSPEQRDEIASGVLEVHFGRVKAAVERGDLGRLEELAGRLDCDLLLAAQHFDQQSEEADRLAAERLRNRLKENCWNEFERGLIFGLLQPDEKIISVELRQIQTSHRMINRGDAAFDRFRGVNTSKSFWYSQLTSENALQAHEDEIRAKAAFIADNPIGGRHLPTAEY